MSYIDTHHHKCPKCYKVFFMRSDLERHLFWKFWHDPRKKSWPI